MYQAALVAFLTTEEDKPPLRNLQELLNSVSPDLLFQGMSLIFLIQRFYLKKSRRIKKYKKFQLMMTMKYLKFQQSKPPQELLKLVSLVRPLVHQGPHLKILIQHLSASMMRQLLTTGAKLASKFWMIICQHLAIRSLQKNMIMNLTRAEFILEILKGQMSIQIS